VPHSTRLIAELSVLVTLVTAQGCDPYAMRVGRHLPRASSTICAFGLPGVRTSLRDTSDGVDVTFVLVGDAAELRGRAHAALAGTYPLRPESRALARRLRTTLRDEPDGLVIHATPLDPAELVSVREAIHHLVEDVLSSGCD
jgi:hypothetical protein